MELILKNGGGIPVNRSGDGKALRISIVIPNYNGETFLRETLKSVIDQQYPNLELIVVDGASTDGSLTVIDEFRSGISKLISEPDRGHADAVNKGFAASTGEVLGWINSDDILLPNSLSFINKLFRARPDIDWITGCPTSMEESGNINWVGPRRKWSRLRFLSGDDKWIQQESTFWRRSLWEKAGGGLDLRFSLANDYDLWRRFFRHAELHFVDRYLGCFRNRAGQRSVKFKDTYLREMDAILDEELCSLDAEFASAFANLLPRSASAARAMKDVSINSKYSVCDPAIISAGEVLGWAPMRGAEEEPPCEPAAAPSSLAQFRNKHRGERCFIMGNGPSLNEMDLSLLESETVFASNSIFLLFDRISWRPKYYACVDSRVLPDRADEIDAMLKENPEMQGFFPTTILDHTDSKIRWSTREILPTAHNRWYFHERPNSLYNLPHSMFSYDIDDAVIQPFTVTITMMQIAAYMGFSEIILIGCDTNYVVADSVTRDITGIALTSTDDHDTNHFDPTYFGKGRKWHDPQPEKMIMHYSHAKAALDAINVRVFNATVGGMLEVFPRRDYQTLFDRTARIPVPAREDEKFNPLASKEERVVKTPLAFIRKYWLHAGLAAALIGATIGVAASLGGSPMTPFVLFAAALILFGGALAIVAIRLRGFIVELSRQVRDVADGAHAPAQGAVLKQIELEEEISRLHEEVRRLKSGVNGRS